VKIEDIFVCGVDAECSVYRIIYSVVYGYALEVLRKFTTMRYINRLFTYLLTYLLCRLTNNRLSPCRCTIEQFRKKFSKIFRSELTFFLFFYSLEQHTKKISEPIIAKPERNYVKSLNSS